MEVMSLLATITKQGTPTREAVTQIRAALDGLSRKMGEDVFKGRTLQESLEAVAK